MLGTDPVEYMPESEERPGSGAWKRSVVRRVWPGPLGHVLTLELRCRYVR